MNVDIIDSTIDAQEFFERYIKTRKPVKLTNFKRIVKFWSNDELKVAGNDMIKCEIRDGSRGFGLGNETSMQFSEFLRRIEKGDQNLYLTTQELEYSLEGQPSLHSPPITSLIQDIPLRPGIMGNLILQNINLWMGSSTTPSSSGLHHDYHDNLYILMRGKKSIDLYSYNDVHAMYPVGQVDLVHPNGRINYHGQRTRADGSHINSEKAWTASVAVRSAAVKLDETKDDSADADLEDALEELLDAEIAAEEDDYEEDDVDVDDDEEKEAPGDKSENDDEHVPEYNSLTNMKRKAEEISYTGKSLKSDRPSNFSLIQTQLPDSEIQEKFPMFLKAKERKLRADLAPGDMLYIPAGWFHEVFSESDSESSNEGHMALNYWFHPPDSGLFETPYSSSFWTEDWNCRFP